jgi:hypothetical protein
MVEEPVTVKFVEVALVRSVLPIRVDEPSMLASVELNAPLTVVDPRTAKLLVVPL